MTHSKYVFAVLLTSLFVLSTLLFVSAARSQDVIDPIEPQKASAPSKLLFNYQGRLLDKSGKPVTSNGMPMAFEIYPQASGGSNCWKETLSGGNAVKVQDGIFQVILGQITTMSTACVTGDAYLQLTVNGEVMSPRERLTSVATAVEATTLTDGAKLGNLLVYGAIEAGPGNNHFYLSNDHGSIRSSSVSSIHYFVDSDNTSEDSESFSVWADNKVLDQPFKLLFSVKETGDATIGRNLEVRGNMDLKGTCVTNVSQSLRHEDFAYSDNCQGGSLTAGAVIEANLQTPQEREMEKIERFSRGDLLCWQPEQQKLELCASENDRLVMAVADGNGKPIVMGAEPVKVIGSITAGDILVSSAEPGRATANNKPLPGTVIGQALESFDGESGLIKAMIRKW